ncbi:hypothetical protein BDQ17DRAFT_1008171 [Cyathus striatus]|nr:hypothetical protein BDQ17DRAFT_1008171 [Cyathus striatus]
MSSPICVETSVPTPPFSSPANFANGAAMNSVRVNNISDEARPDDMVTDFSTLIDIRTFETRNDSSGTYLEISFNNQDTLKKALCMNGYALSDTSMYVFLY